jgi:hypothetical protein
LYADHTDSQLLSQLRIAIDKAHGPGVIEALVGELEERAIRREAAGENADAHLWPQGVFDTALEIFGRGVYARNGRSYKSLDLRISHALRVWDSKYGPLNPEQEAYAVDVLCFVMRAGHKAARGDKKQLWPRILTRLARCVNDERVHAGFVRRAGDIDVSESFRELLEAS